MLWQPSLPEKYRSRTAEQTADAIRKRRGQLGDDLVILGHHYQQDDVIRHVDFAGDSFQLSRLAAEQVRARCAKYVIFCGVHFMAESADILTPQDVAVILPDLAAGCSMADMADYDQTCQAWEEIHDALLGDRADASSIDRSVRVIPITYMNSTAAIKAFVGEHGGAVCTSSNAARVFSWALAGGTEPLREGEEIKILFVPDQHLGRNTAHAAGFVTELDARRNGRRPQTAVWDPHQELGGLDEQQIRDAVVLLWKGHCSVHMLFRPEHVQQSRLKHPDVTVLVHPECSQEVVECADMTGSTELICKSIRNAEPGSHWAIGTEVHLVNRLAREAAERDVHVEMLSGCQCLCTTMYRISPERLLWVLDGLVGDKIHNRITVHADARRSALIALNRMLELTAPGDVSTPRVAVAAPV